MLLTRHCSTAGGSVNGCRCALHSSLELAGLHTCQEGFFIASWKHDASPEHITKQFPTLSLADVYGVITYFLDHQQELDAHFTRLEEEYERARLASRAERSEFYDGLRQRIEAWRAAHIIQASDGDSAE